MAIDDTPAPQRAEGIRAPLTQQQRQEFKRRLNDAEHRAADMATHLATLERSLDELLASAPRSAEELEERRSRLAGIRRSVDDAAEALRPGELRELALSGVLRLSPISPN